MKQSLIIANKIYYIYHLSYNNFGLSCDFTCNCQIITNKIISDDSLLNKTAVINLDAQKIYGVVTRINDEPATPDHKQRYCITISSILHPLTSTSNNRIFVNKDIITIMREILTNYHILTNTDFLLNNKLSSQALTVQYQQSDFDFLNQQLSHNGLFFTFRRDRIIITDNIKKLDNIFTEKTVVFQSNFTLTKTAKLLTKEHTLRDYNYMTSEIDLTATNKQTSIKHGYGRKSLYGLNILTQPQLEKQAKQLQETTEWQSAITTLICNSDVFSPGQIICLTNHPIGRHNGTYYVINAAYTSDLTGGQIYGTKNNHSTCRSTLTLIPTRINYRQPTTPQQLAGFHIAKIIGKNNDYADIDSFGRYHAKLIFALEGDNKSNRLRLAQPYCGSDYGLHFPLRANTKVIFTCINGDINRPVILGALANREHPSPVTARNTTESILKSHTNKLIMNDENKHESILLATENGDNSLTLNNNPSSNRIALATKRGSLKLQAKNDINFSCNNYYQNCSKNYEVYSKETLLFQAKSKDIIINANNSINIKAKNHIKTTTTAGDINHSSGHNYLIKSNNNMRITSNNGTLKVIAKTGDLLLQGKQNLIIKKGAHAKITISRPGASITIDANNNIKFHAKQIDVICKQTNLTGETIELASHGT